MSIVDYLPYSDLVDKWKSLGKSDYDILSLGIKGKLSFYSVVDRVTCRWYAVLEADTSQATNAKVQLDSLGDMACSKQTFLQVSPQCLARIAVIKEPVDVLFECPFVFRPTYYDEHDENYCIKLFPINFAEMIDIRSETWGEDPEKLRKEDPDVLRCSRIDRTRLWIKEEDVNRLQGTFEGESAKDEPVPMLIGKAAKKMGCDIDDLLRKASKGQKILELLVRIKYRDIVGGVQVSDKSSEEGYFLAVPSFHIERLIVTGDAFVDAFDLPTTYSPSTAGQILLQQLVSSSPDLKICTKHHIQIQKDGEQLYVAERQIEILLKKPLDSRTATVQQFLTMPGQPIVANGLHSGAENSKVKVRKNSGRKSSFLREVIEYLYEKLSKEGTTSFLQAGNVGEFIKKMREIRKADQDEFVSERIKEVKKVAGNWKITTEEKIVKISKTRETSDISSIYNQNSVSKILSIIRKEKH